MSDGQNPLSRWSQRKLAAQHGEEVVADAKPPDVPAPASEREPPVLPPIEELTAESDYTAFLAKDVPEALTRAALRKLWTSDPVFANLDGLNHYDEDYNVIDKAITLAQTGYHPERGYLDVLADKGEGTPSDAEHKESVSPAPEEEADVAIDESDAPVDSEPDAPRQVAAAVADGPDVKSQEEPSK